MATGKAYRTAAPTEFKAAIALVPAHLRTFLSPYTAAEYEAKGAACYLSEDGRSGYALTSEADLISVFSLPGAGQGSAAIKSAIANGAQTLDCIDGYLPRFYAQFGFVECDRIAWDDQYAPEGWDYGRFGRPDIVFMRRG